MRELVSAVRKDIEPEFAIRYYNKRLQKASRRHESTSLEEKIMAACRHAVANCVYYGVRYKSLLREWTGERKSRGGYKVMKRFTVKEKRDD